MLTKNLALFSDKNHTLYTYFITKKIHLNKEMQHDRLIQKDKMYTLQEQGKVPDSLA